MGSEPQVRKVFCEYAEEEQTGDKATECERSGRRQEDHCFVGYSGETAKELFSYPAEGQHEALVAGFREGIQAKAAQKGERALTHEERVVLMVAALEEEVNNGGFDQFFRTHRGDLRRKLLIHSVAFGAQEWPRLLKEV